MPELSYNEIADQQLERLDQDPLRPELRARVNGVLDALESNPGDERLRRKEFRQLPDWGFCYAVEVRGDGEEWVVLWSWNPDKKDESVVIYVGAPRTGSVDRRGAPSESTHRCSDGRVTTGARASRG